VDIRKSKKAKKCKVCGKGLRIQNKSGLCSHHYKMQYWNKIRKERKKKHQCISCGVKVNQKLKFSFKDKKYIKFYPLRCHKCNERNKRFLRKYNHKPEVMARRKKYYHDNKEKFKKYFQEYNQSKENGA